MKLNAFLLFSIYTMTTSCVWMKPANERIADSRNKISTGFQKELYQQKFKINQGALDISWQQGLNKMYLSNPSLIQADFRIADAKQNQKQVWRDMTPGLTLGVTDSFNIGELGDAFSNPIYRINSFLSLGNLLDLPKNVYSRKLTYIGTELSAENSMRQQVIALYRLFQEQRLLKLQKRAIDIEGELVQRITGIEGSEIIAMRLNHKNALDAWVESEQNWKVKVGDFFMAGYDSINLRPSGIPDITYNPSSLDFSDTNRWGLLQLNLLALEDIAEKGRFLDTYFRYLPRANMTVSAPPLFSNTNNRSFDPTLIRLNPSLNWSLDSRGFIGRQLNRLKREAPLRQWRKDRRQREEVKKLLEGKKALTEVQLELAKLRQVMDDYKQIVASGLVEDPEKAIQTLRRLREREVRLTAREIEICTAFWLIDEQRWKPITKRWLATRSTRTKIRETDKNRTTLRSLLKK